jgi:uncharacterized membrane protein YgdD (TMEM256/DUF423 family)
MARVWMVLGALSGLVAVAMAAWASHGLPAEAGARAMTGVSLQAWHALALLGTGLFAERRPGRRMPHAAGVLFVLGTVLFCGGVYSRVVLDLSWGVLTPLGGVALMMGWGVLAASAIPRP